MKRPITIIVLCAIAVSIALNLGPRTITYERQTPKEVIPEVPAILKKIAWCESRGKQFKEDGTVVRGIVNPHDIGKYQINETLHASSARALGMDIFTLAGNTKFALHLYETQGTRPWKWSESCWGSKRAKTAL